MSDSGGRYTAAGTGSPAVLYGTLPPEGTGDFGYNAKTDQYVNMIEDGVIDPTKVARVALENAASVAGMLITTEAVVTEIKKDEPAMPMGGGMPGMM